MTGHYRLMFRSETDTIVVLVPEGTRALDAVRLVLPGCEWRMWLQYRGGGGFPLAPGRYRTPDGTDWEVWDVDDRRSATHRLVAGELVTV